jgi:hypothetical protein
MAAIYDGLEFRTALEAHWAAFFDLAGWEWRYNPAPVGDWKPEFHVTFACGHSECNDNHSLLVAILPVSELKTLRGHPALTYAYSVPDTHGGSGTIADAGALFGSNAGVTGWEMSHGAGGGVHEVSQWVDHSHHLWISAGERVRR